MTHPARMIGDGKRKVQIMSVSSKFGANVVSLVAAVLFGAAMLSAAVPVLPIA